MLALPLLHVVVRQYCTLRALENTALGCPCEVPAYRTLSHWCVSSVQILSDCRYIAANAIFTQFSDTDI